MILSFKVVFYFWFVLIASDTDLRSVHSTHRVLSEQMRR